jgi:SHS2 domain-containing protein
MPYKAMYRWIEHTAELELAIEAPTAEDVFREAVAAFAELVGNGDGSQPAQRRIELEADEPPELLADLLDELVWLADAQGFVPQRVTELALGDRGLRATLEGHRGDPRPIVKAATRHRLALERVDGGDWHARVVLDV